MATAKIPVITFEGDAESLRTMIDDLNAQFEKNLKTHILEGNSTSKIEIPRVLPRVRASITYKEVI